MKVLLDTNVILDIALNRQPFVEQAISLFQAPEGKLIFHVTASSITDIYYIINKKLKHEKSIEFILDLLDFCKICPQTKSTFLEAANSKFDDFEDAVQYFCAKSADIEAIITRNKSDFLEAELPVYSPKEFLEQL